MEAIKVILLVIFFCKTTSSKLCIDDSKQCSGWKDKGYCKTTSIYSTYMREKCQRSCDECIVIVPPAIAPACSDESDYCASYKPYCKDPGYVKYLIENCKYTCNYCHITTPAPTTTVLPTIPYTGPSGRVLQPGCGSKGRTHTRIIGGSIARPGDWPWQVNFGYINSTAKYKHHCGGTLISLGWVVSAAHCFIGDTNKERYWLTVGDNDLKLSSKWEQKFSIKELILHPKYNNTNYDNDLALIRIDGVARINDRVKPACLPGMNETFDVGTKCYISGYGRLERPGDYPVLLRQAEVPLVLHNTCWKTFISKKFKITPSMLCAGYAFGKIDSCDGDSGGPLVCRKYDPVIRDDIWYLWGAISWGVGCARKGFYGVYADIKANRQWIDQNVYKTNV